MKYIIAALSTASVLLFSTEINASTIISELDSTFEALKNNPRSYEDKGAICEEIAKVFLQKKYPEPQYSIHIGIAYGDLTSTIGELDEVIIDNSSNKVLKILEVKCWTDLAAGKEKAEQQRSRFLKNIRSTKELYFISTSTQNDFDQNLFEGVNDFVSIGQKGAVASGYDFELPFTMKEIMNLRSRLLRCQSDGNCPTP